MDRFDVISFSDLTGPEGAEKWVRIGGGSFGVVFSGEYLGTQVAIKEVLPNNTYDVEKYFERECVLMKEARHPNITQYIGLTKSPGPDGRIYIISEFVGGNLRSFIADTRKAFPWRLRLSFATDIARALAYLHARNCMHRDLKGENLLITANDRIKVCDFGFARIAARNEEEMRRISYCGTDGYMSPEILMGVDFSLPSDIFSLGIIFCEILSRKLVDSNTFKRQIPGFGIDAEEVFELASDGCPKEFIQLALDCVEEDPANRPTMRDVVKRLRTIEQEVIAMEKRENGAVYAVGSIRGSSLHAVMGSKAKRMDQAARPGLAPKMPSFSGQVDVKKANKEANEAKANEKQLRRTPSEGSSSSSEDMDEALAALEQIGIDPNVVAAADEPVVQEQTGADGKKKLVATIKAGSTFKVAGHGNPWWADDDNSLISINSSWVRASDARKVKDAAKAAPPRTSSILTVKKGENGHGAEYSTSVVRSSRISTAHAPLASTMSVMTARQALDADAEHPTASTMTVKQVPRVGGGASSSNFLGDLEVAVENPNASSSVSTPAASYMTARSKHMHGGEPSLANATISSSTIRADAAAAAAAAAEAEAKHDGPQPLFHRFTLVKNGMKRPSNLTATATAAISGVAGSAFGSLMPPAVMLTNALAKCWVCGKRIGWKPFLDCDDCPYKTHVACGELAEPTCQELILPPPRSGSSTPVVSPEQVSARRLSRSKSPEQGYVSAAAAALRAATRSPAPDASLANKDVNQPTSQQKSNGLRLKLKRNSTSPPPVPATTTSPTSAGGKKGIRA